MSSRILAVFLSLVAALMLLPLTASAQTDRGPELDTEKDYYVRIVTSKGEIVCRLFASEAPLTVKHFVNLAEGTCEFRDPATGKWTKRPYFNGIQFHRVIPDFMVQTGDPTATGRGGPGFSFRDEFVPTRNFTKPGILAMANGGPNTNGSQFFITEIATEWLNQKHTIFGEILEGTDGLDVVKSIARVEKTAGDKPREPLLMERVEIFRLEKDLAAADALAKIKAGEGRSKAGDATAAAE
jgi:peptidyl-prolyl cis-trans isomerase A (cyclophilin A)